MAHFHVKRKRGRPYLYVREMSRVDGRLKVTSQVYIGSPERVLQLATSADQADSRLKVEEFGALWAATEMDRDVNLVGIVDGVVRPDPRESGPSVGEYFLYAVLNRLVKPKSKRALPEWYSHTAIQQIRPTDIQALTSERYWAKWDRVGEKDLETIARQFFERIWELEKPAADCILFDTTNYYTFMATDTESELAMRGKNKAGRHQLRQIGLGLLVSRESRLPLYYSVYPGNRHDSQEFGRLMDEMFGIVAGLDRTKERLTVVIDKGMNSEENFTWIDEHARAHFVTSYSPYFAQELATIPLEQFEPIDTRKNRQLRELGQTQDQMRVFRTRGEFWGKDRAVVVTHYPPTARKQEYTFDSKLEQLRQELLEMRSKVRDRAPHWRIPQAIEDRYHRACERLHISSDYYTLEFVNDEDGGLTLSFRKNLYHVEQKRKTFGRSIIITDNTDWTTLDIVETNLDRWEVEDGFRQSKDRDLVGVQPVRHWTDSKIRCHLFTCVVALTYARRLEIRLKSNGLNKTAKAALEDLSKLHSVLKIEAGKTKPTIRRQLEEPTKTQAAVLKALGYRVDQQLGLRPLTP